MGVVVEYPPEATFYIWANLSLLPPPLDNGIQFFEEALTEKVFLSIYYFKYLLILL